MRKIHLIGVGPGNPELVTAGAVRLIQHTSLLAGSEKALKTSMAAAGDPDVPKFVFKETKEVLSFVQEHPEYPDLCMVFSGDTSTYSGAIPLKKALEECREEQFEIDNVPGVSSIQYFLSHGGLSMSDVKLISLHGRTMDVVPIIRENPYVCVLLDEEEDVSAIAKKLSRYGLNETLITVGEHLSLPEESFVSGHPREFRNRRFERLAIALIRNEGYKMPTHSYGIADDHFLRTGALPITRRDVRALSLCRLAIRANSVIYDIGAGTGSVTIEAALACPEGQVIAVEKDEDAAIAIEQNRSLFQVDNVRVLRGCAPDCFQEFRLTDPVRADGGRGAVILPDEAAQEERTLPKPDSIFIGGNEGDLAEIVNWAVSLNPNVTIVINTVTLEGISEILAIEKKLTDYNFEMAEIQATGLERRGSYHMHHAENPVTITRIAHR